MRVLRILISAAVASVVTGGALAGEGSPGTSAQYSGKGGPGNMDQSAATNFTIEIGPCVNGERQIALGGGSIAGESILFPPPTGPNGQNVKCNFPGVHGYVMLHVGWFVNVETKKPDPLTGEIVTTRYTIWIQVRIVEGAQTTAAPLVNGTFPMAGFSGATVGAFCDLRQIAIGAWVWSRIGVSVPVPAALRLGALTVREPRARRL